MDNKNDKNNINTNEKNKNTENKPTEIKFEGSAKTPPEIKFEGSDKKAPEIKKTPTKNQEKSQPKDEKTKEEKPKEEEKAPENKEETKTSEKEPENKEEKPKKPELKVIDGKKSENKKSDKKKSKKKTDAKKPEDKGSEEKAEEKSDDKEQKLVAKKEEKPKKVKKKRIKPPKKASNIKKLKAMRPTKKQLGRFVKQNRTSIIAVVAIFVLIFLSFLFNAKNIIKIGEKQVMFSKEYSMSSKSDFYVNGDDIYYVSKDGMLYLDKKGQTLWSDTFTMAAPYMLNDGGYAAVADSSSKIINVYDKTGRIYQITAAGEITTFAINPLGFCAVVCKSGDDYRVDVYSNTGETMFECARASKDGIPLGIDVSDDGSIVSISLVDYNDIKIKSSILFYYTAKADAQSIESSDGLVSAIEVPEAIAAIVKFTPDNHCIVASDTSMMNIDCSSKNAFKKDWEKTFDNYVTAFNIVDNEEIAIAYGEPVDITNEKAQVQENSVHWYNLNGREIGLVKVDGRVDYISSSSYGTIVAVNKDFVAYNSRGRELWRYSAVQNIKAMEFYNSVDRVLLIGTTKMQLLDVKKGVTMQEEGAEEETEVTTQANTQATTTQVATGA